MALPLWFLKQLLSFDRISTGSVGVAVVIVGSSFSTVAVSSVVTGCSVFEPSERDIADTTIPASWSNTINGLRTVSTVATHDHYWRRRRRRHTRCRRRGL